MGKTTANFDGNYTQLHGPAESERGLSNAHPHCWNSVMSPGDDGAKNGVMKVGKAGRGTAFDFDSELLARFDFGGRFGVDGFPSVSPVQQTKFRADFLAQVAKVLAQLHKYGWLAPDVALPPRAISGPYRPQTDFHVFISEMYAKSRSLVPAWFGQRGWMEFPAYRVAAGEAALAHEIVHVLFPNASRMLAEGLSVYLQDKLSDAPVYPNFGEPLEDLLESFLSTYKDQAPDMLWKMDLDAFEQISTPDELGLRLGRVMIGAKPGAGLKQGDDEPPTAEVRTVYALAGSLVEFLLENPIEDDLLTEKNFGALYNSTPLRPLERCSGSPDRWQASYKGKGISYSFTDIGLLWKTYMHVILFSGEKDEIPIPDDYRKMKLVAQLYSKLKSIEDRALGNPAARKRRQKK
jgi:hypothetical protein